MEPLELVPGRYIGEGQPCFIIAELGQNHQGDLNIAKQLISKAKECGADCVKLQKSCLEEKFTPDALIKPYESPHSWGNTYGEHKQFLEFSEEQFKELQTHACDIGIPLTASAMDSTSVNVLASLDVPFLKVGSGDAHNLPLIKLAAETGKPLVISTGMCDISWVSQVYNTITEQFPSTPLVLLQCTSSYPAPAAHAHLRVIDTYAQMFPRAHIGYSGHELGINVSIAAVTRGARVLERHITLNKGWKGTDHQCSLEPHDLRNLICAVRDVEEALGSPLKAFQPSEEIVFKKLGKSVVAACDLNAGSELVEEDLIAKVSIEGGVAARHLTHLVGRTLIQDLSKDQQVLLNHLL